MIEVLEPGALTTVQDLGRPGLGRWGVPPSGAMDALGLRAANLVCGNAQGAAGLECTIAGPVLRFETDAVVALGGSAFSSTLDGEPAAHLAAFRVTAGQTLTVGRTTSGARCYVCVRGGLATEEILGSRSAYPAGGIGRAIASGDRLPVGDADHDAMLRSVDARALPGWASGITLRAVRGPQDAAFAPESRRSFFAGRFTVATLADRTGVRLAGPPLEHKERAEIAPEGLVAGAVQVPPDGAPIVLGPDRPATGGYAKIATVIGADLGGLGQAKPGDEICFAEMDVGEAWAAWAALEARLISAVQ